MTLCALLALGGCASVPPPDSAMNMAQIQLQAARDADAVDYAPVDLGFAQHKFLQAQAAMASRKYADAARLADEARADAELALVKAQLGETRAKIRAKLDENRRLRQQMEQAHPELSGQPAPMPSSLPPAAPTGDMPAPSSSVLHAPLSATDGFQTMPQHGASSAGTSQGEQP